MPKEETPTTTTTEQPDAKPQASPAATGQIPNQNQNADASGETPLSALPQSWQDEIKNLREENKQRRIAEDNSKREAERKAEADLEARQEWEKLAKKRETEIAELKPAIEESAKLAEIIQGQINAEIKDWPKEIVDTAPEAEVSAIEMHTWFSKMKPLAQRLMNADNQENKSRPGNRPGPNPASITPGGGQAPSANETPDIIGVSRRF